MQSTASCKPLPVISSLSSAPPLHPSFHPHHLTRRAQAQTAPGKDKPAADKEKGPDENQFDEFMGSDAALLAGTAGEYDKDDREADEIYATIDEFMDGRRRVRCHRVWLPFCA